MNDTEIRAKNAQALLENPLFNEVMDTIEKEAIDAWISTGLSAAPDRERHWMLVKTARRVREVLQGYVDNNEFEARRAARAPLP